MSSYWPELGHTTAPAEKVSVWAGHPDARAPSRLLLREMGRVNLA